MKVTRETVQQLAELAQLRLEDAEAERMRRDLDQILRYVDQLQALDTQGVEPTAHVLDLATPLRADETRDVLPVERAVANAPEHDEASMIVPKVLE